MNYYFLFCQDELLLTSGGDVPLRDESPIRLEAWQHLHHLPDLNGHACFTARLDTPVLGDEWQMVPLRASFDVLPALSLIHI